MALASNDPLAPLPVYGDGTDERPWVYQIEAAGIRWTHVVDASADEGSGASVDDLIDNIDAVLEAYRA